MNILPTIFMLAFFACLYFAAKPLKGHTKWHGLLAALFCFVMIGMTAPKEPKTSAEAATKDERVQVSRSSTSGDRSPASPYSNVAKQYAWIRASKDALEAKLKDSESARYRNVAFYSGAGTPVVCGEVNARNSFGGYGGYERFIAAGSTMAYLESEVSDGIGPVWEQLCVRKPGDEARER